VDLRDKDRIDRNLLEENEFRNANDYIQYYIHKSKKNSTKKMFITYWTRRFFCEGSNFFTPDAKREFQVFEGSV